MTSFDITGNSPGFSCYIKSPPGGCAARGEVVMHTHPLAREVSQATLYSITGNSSWRVNM